MKLVEEKVIREVTKPYWENVNRSIVETDVLKKYTNDEGYEIKVTECFGYFTDDKKYTIKYKTNVEVYKDGKFIRKKLYFMGSKKWGGMSVEELINETLIDLP